MKLHFQIDGPENGTPLVLLNGLFADLHSWDKAMAWLSGFRVLRFDGRGQGQSAKPEGTYHLELLVEDALELLDELNFPKAHLVGISNGGCLGMAIAEKYPDRVDKLVVADAYHTVSPLLKLKIRSWLRAHQCGGPSHRFEIAIPWIWSNAMLEENPSYLETYRQKAVLHHPVAVNGLLTGALLHEIDIRAIEADTLLLAGEEDVLTPPASMASMCDAMPLATFQQVRGAHASLLEHPEIFGDVIVPFLKGRSHVG